MNMSQLESVCVDVQADEAISNQQSAVSGLGWAVLLSLNSRVRAASKKLGKNEWRVSLSLRWLMMLRSTC